MNQSKIQKTTRYIREDLVDGDVVKRIETVYDEEGNVVLQKSETHDQLPPDNLPAPSSMDFLARAKAIAPQLESLRCQPLPKTQPEKCVYVPPCNVTAEVVFPKLDFPPYGDKPIKTHAEKVAEVEHNEEKFEVKRHLMVGKYQVLWVYYPDCPNGNKIMVYLTKCQSGGLPEFVNERKRINPHFGKKDSPFARFEPTESGWFAALQFAEMMK